MLYNGDMEKEKFNIVTLVSNDGCFDLQFRKDTRHERSGSPTYYRWKIQFVITTPKENVKVLEKAKKIIGCGNVSVAGSQARFSVQKIGDITDAVIPYFQKNTLAGKKKKDFDLWQKAVEIIRRNKGVPIAKWKKSDLLYVMEIHNLTAKYKQKPRKQKWIEMARTLAKTT